MVSFFSIAVVVFGIYIFDYYRKEKRRKEIENVYKLYKITFENNGETYFQIIGAMSEKGARQIFYQDHSNADAEIIEVVARVNKDEKNN